MRLLLLLLLAGCPTPTYDFDGDGITDDLDCAPENPAVFPGADDVWGDDIDQDCDVCPAGRGDGVDRDCDGFAANAPPPSIDCDDDEPDTHPGADEIVGDGIDQDCDGTDLVDQDGDGHPAGADDCDDLDALVYSGADELADCIDNDCDGVVDEELDTLDADGDGSCVGVDAGEGLFCCFDAEPGDCDDNDASASPVDTDNDGFDTCGPDGLPQSGDEDCDDLDNDVAPDQPEICNRVDDDCDGEVNEGCDADGDGLETCGPNGELGDSDDDCDDNDASLQHDDEDEDGVSSCDGDCDDSDPARSTQAAEILADGIDQDCDDNDLLLAEDFDSGSWDPSAWTEWHFTTGHLLQSQIGVANDALWSRVASNQQGWAEEQALASALPVDFSSPLVIEYEHHQPTLDPAIGLTWQSFLALAPDDSTLSYVIGNGVGAQADFPPKTDLLYVGRRAGSLDRMLFEHRSGASQGDGSTLSYVPEFFTPGAGHVVLTLDATTVTLVVDEVEQYSGPHDLPFTSGTLFFGNYADWDAAAHEATFDDIEVRRPL